MADQADNNRSGGAWRPGTSGNPSGRPVGAVRKMTAKAMARLDRHGEEIIQQAIDSALDPTSPAHAIALRLCVERLIPVARHQPDLKALTLPAMASPRDLPGVCAALLVALIEGRIALPDIQPVLQIIQTTAQAVATGDHDQRLALLEEQIANRSQLRVAG